MRGEFALVELKCASENTIPVGIPALDTVVATHYPGPARTAPRTPVHDGRREGRSRPGTAPYTRSADRASVAGRARVTEGEVRGISIPPEATWPQPWPRYEAEPCGAENAGAAPDHNTWREAGVAEENLPPNEEVVQSGRCGRTPPRKAQRSLAISNCSRAGVQIGVYHSPPDSSLGRRESVPRRVEPAAGSCRSSGRMSRGG